MFKKLLDSYRERKAVVQFLRSSLGEALHKHTQEYLYGDTMLASCSDEFKKTKATELTDLVLSIINDENTFLKLRENIAGYVINYSELFVLCLTEVEKAESDFYSSSPYISGELYKHIQELVEHVEYLKKVKWEKGNKSDEGWIALCNINCDDCMFYIQALNIMRVEIKDFSKEKDWFLPFVESQLIYYENKYRGNIGIPCLLPGIMDGLKHSIFLDFVRKGYENPLYEWEQAVEKMESED